MLADQAGALLAGGADVNFPLGRNRWAPLHRACARGDAAMAALLLERPDVAVNAPAKDGWTPLH